ncbi:MAG: putative PEP-binding protein [Candidatus Omnitrophota bacterium]
MPSEGSRGEPTFEEVEQRLLERIKREKRLIDSFRGELPEELRDINTVPVEFVKECLNDMFTREHVVHHGERLYDEIFELWQLFGAAKDLKEVGENIYYLALNDRMRETSRDGFCTQIIIATPDRLGSEAQIIDKIGDAGIEMIKTFHLIREGVALSLYQLQSAPGSHRALLEEQLSSMLQVFRDDAEFEIADTSDKKQDLQRAIESSMQILNNPRKCVSNGNPGGVSDALIFNYSAAEEGEISVDGTKVQYGIDEENAGLERIHFESVVEPMRYRQQRNIERGGNTAVIAEGFASLLNGLSKFVKIEPGRDSAAVQMKRVYEMLSHLGGEDEGTSVRNMFAHAYRVLGKGFRISEAEVEIEQNKLYQSFNRVKMDLHRPEKVEKLAIKIMHFARQSIRKDKYTARFALWNWLEENYPEGEEGRSEEGKIAEKIVNEICLQLDLEEIIFEGLDELLDRAKKDGRQVIVMSRVPIRDELRLVSLSERHGVKYFVACKGSSTEHVTIFAQDTDALYLFGLPGIMFDEFAITGRKASMFTSERGFEGYVSFDDQKQEDETVREIHHDVDVSNALRRFFIAREIAIRAERETARTMDGQEFAVFGNINLEGEGDSQKLIQIYSRGANGIALARTEYLYDRATPPDYATQAELYQRLADVADRPITLRTFDKRHDKECSSLPDVNGISSFDYYETEPGREALKTQLKALLVAYARSEYRNIKVMFPMVKGVDDIEFIRDVLEEAKKEVLAALKGVTKGDLDKMPIGIMVENKEIVRNLDAVLTNKFVRISFLSIGTNDLIADVKGISRKEFENEDFDKEILRIMEQVIIYAGKRDIETVTVCGDVARFDKTVLFSLYFLKKHGIQLIPGVVGGMVPKLKTEIEVTDANNVFRLFEHWEDMEEDRINHVVGEKARIRVSRIEKDDVFKKILAVEEAKSSSRDQASGKMPPSAGLALFGPVAAVAGLASIAGIVLAPTTVALLLTGLGLIVLGAIAVLSVKRWREDVAKRRRHEDLVNRLTAEFKERMSRIKDPTDEEINEAFTDTLLHVQHTQVISVLDGAAYGVFVHFVKEWRKDLIRTRLEQPAAIVIGIAGISGEDEIIKEINSKIGGVKIVALDASTEEKNMKILEEAKREYGAYAQGIINIKETGIKKDELPSIVNRLVDEIQAKDKRLLTLSNPKKRLKKADREALKDIRGIFREIGRALPVIKYLEVSEVSAYNMRFTNNVKVNTIDELSHITTKYIKDEKTGKLASIRANSLGGVKLLAEAHRKRMKEAGYEDPKKAPVKLQIRLAVSADEAKDIERNKRTLLERMEIDDVLGENDLVVMDRKLADAQTVSDIYKNIQGYKAENIAIIEPAKEGRSEKELPKDEIVFMEYKGTATSVVYDITVTLLAKDKEARLLQSHKFEQGGEKRVWLILPPVQGVDTKELREEIERYHKILIGA